MVIGASPAHFNNETGAHITIFARRQGPLDDAKVEVLAARQDTNQEVNIVSLDLGNRSEVRFTFPPEQNLSRRERLTKRTAGCSLQIPSSHSRCPVLCGRRYRHGDWIYYRH